MASKEYTSVAFLLRCVPYGDSDLIATFFTEAHGKLVMRLPRARAGGKANKRLGGALEPFHTLQIRYVDPSQTAQQKSEYVSFKDGEIVGLRAALTRNLECMEAGAIVLRWLRHLCPPRAPDRKLIGELQDTFSQLDRFAKNPDLDPQLSRQTCLHFADVVGLRLLYHQGYGLLLDACVSCHKKRPASKSSYLDSLRGGVVCQACLTSKLEFFSAYDLEFVQRVLISSNLDFYFSNQGPYPTKLTHLVRQMMLMHADCK